MLVIHIWLDYLLVFSFVQWKKGIEWFTDVCARNLAPLDRLFSLVFQSGCWVSWEWYWSSRQSIFPNILAPSPKGKRGHCAWLKQKLTLQLPKRPQYSVEERKGTLCACRCVGGVSFLFFSCFVGGGVGWLMCISYTFRQAFAHSPNMQKNTRVQGCSDATWESVNEQFYRVTPQRPCTCYLSHASTEGAVCVCYCRSIGRSIFLRSNMSFRLLEREDIWHVLTSGHVCKGLFEG